MSVQSGMSQLSSRLQRKVNQALSGQAGINPTSITLSDADTQANRTSELVEIIDIRVPKGYVYAFPGNQPIQMYLMTHEEFTSDGTGGDDETFSLSNDLVNSPTVSDVDTSQTSGGAEVDSSGHQDLVVYDSGTQKAVVSVDYDADTFTYADAGTNSTIDAYYLWGDSSEIHGRKVSDDFEEYKQVLGTTASTVHRSNVFSESQQVSFTNQFALDEKEHLKFLINTGVDLTNWDDANSYSYIQLPVYKIPK